MQRRALWRDSDGVAPAAILIVAAVVGLIVIVVALVVVRSGSDDGETDDSLRSEQSAESEAGAGAEGSTAQGDTATEQGDTGSQRDDAETGSEAADAEGLAFSESQAGQVIKELAPDYGADGDAALNCIEQNIVGGFTDEERAIIYSNPNAATWPPGLGEKFAAVLEECIPLEPFYLAQFGAYSFTDPGCVRAMTDHVLGAYSWAVFIVKGIMDADLYPSLQAEFDAHVNAGYQAKECYAA